MATNVYYDNRDISPAPFVARSYEPINYGSRWGVSEAFELRGVYTGANLDYASTISGITALFSGQFRNLKVISNGDTVIDEDYVVLEEINIPDSRFLIGEPIAYNVRLKTYHVPSNVINPVNEYSFSEDQDVVSVVHKISAQGVKTSASAFQNAIDYVEQFVGKNPYTNCNPLFLNNSSGALFSSVETVDRIEGSYAVTETYKYNTGVGTSRNYLIEMNLDLSEGINNDYNVVDVTINYKGSPWENNLAALRSQITGTPILKQIKDYYGINTGALVLNTVSIDEISGANTVSIKANYLSGASSDITGYFGYTIDLSVDEIRGLQSYTINGEFISRGAINNRREAVENFVSSIGGDYESYLYGKILSSSLYSVFNDASHPLCPQVLSLSFNYDTGLASLSLSASYNNRDYVPFAQVVDYEVRVDAAKPIFKMLPSANIEGHYVIQDLQCVSQEKTTLVSTCTSSGTSQAIEDGLWGIAANVSGEVFGSNTTTVISRNTTSGKFDAAVEVSLYTDSNIPLLTNVKDSIVGPYNTRQTQTKFGY